MLLTVGDWELPPLEGPRDITSLVETIGRPDPGAPASPPSEYLGNCGLQWEELGLWAYANNLGMPPSGKTICDPEVGLIQSMTMSGPGSRRWRNAASLRVGDDLARLQRLHPQAVRLDPQSGGPRAVAVRLVPRQSAV